MKQQLNSTETMTLQEQIETQETLSQVLDTEGLLEVCLRTTLYYGYNGVHIFLNDMLSDVIQNIEDDMGLDIPYEMTEKYYNQVGQVFYDNKEFLQSLEVEQTTDKFGDDVYIYNGKEYDFYPQMIEDILENISQKVLVVSE